MIIALTGLCGSGKSTAAEFFEKKGFSYYRFGQVTEDNLKEQGLENNPENNQVERERIRKEGGMDAFAKLALPKLEEYNKKGNVLADGMYSFEEYLFLREKLEKELVVICVYTDKKLRYERLKTRTYRPHTTEQTKQRDYTEIKNLNKGGTIAIADYTVLNNTTKEELNKQLERIWGEING